MERLREESFFTAVRPVDGQTKSFPSVGRKILSFLNSFLVSAESESMGYKHKLKFSKRAVAGKNWMVFSGKMDLLVCWRLKIMPA